MFNFLATLRLNQRTLMVGPKRRVVFTAMWMKTATGENVTKRDVKRALAPLKSFWSKPEENEPRTQPDVPVMSYREFRNNARILLTDAGLLEESARDE